jgi:hypothetical protein
MESMRPLDKRIEEKKSVTPLKRKSIIAVGVFWMSLSLVNPAMAVTGGTMSFQVDGAKTKLAIVTGKEGIASGFAHRHIIVARGVSGHVELSGSKDQSATQIKSAIADVEFLVDQMAVDSVADAAGIIPMLVSAGVWNESEDKIEPSNGEQVRKNMLAESQLDGKRFPKIMGHGVLSQCQAVGPDESQCSLSLTLTIKGASVKRDLQAKLMGRGSQLEAQFSAPMKFSDFGMTAYSAMMGAIRVSDAILIAAVIRL